MNSVGAVGSVNLPQNFWFSIYGPLEIGTQLGLLLYGAFTAVAYLHKCRTESWLHRGLIGALLFTAGLETLLGALQAIEYTAVHTADASFISSMSNGANAWVQPLVFSVTPLLAQVYMTMRVLLLARNKRRADPENKARGLMTVGGLLIVLLLLAWGATYGAIIDMVVSRTSIGQFMAASGDAAKIYRAMEGASVCLLLAVNFVVMAVTTSQLKFKRKGFFFTIADGLMSVIVRNNLLVTVASGAQVAMVFAVTAWSTIIPMFIGKLYALTVLLIIAYPAYTSSSARDGGSCDLCKLHAHAISSAVKRCPACGAPLRRGTEMSEIPLSPSPKAREMSVFPSTDAEVGDVGIPSLHIRMNPPVGPRYSMDSEGPTGEKQV